MVGGHTRLPWQRWPLLSNLIGLFGAVGCYFSWAAPYRGQSIVVLELIALPALLLLGGFFAGRVVMAFGLPRLTGFILFGVAVGPEVGQLLTYDQVGHIKVIKDLAIGLIALMAGAEIRLEWLRKRLRAVLGVVFAQVLMVPVVIMTMVMLAHALFPMVQVAVDHGVALPLVGLLLGTLALANSPMVVVSR